MIKVNVKKVKKEIDDFSSLLTSYKNNHKALEYQYNSMILNWKNNKAPIIFSSINDNQLTNIKMICILEDEIKTLKLVVDKYGDLGNSIECKLEQEDYILSKYYNIIDKLQKVLVKFNSLSDISSYKKYSTILEQKNIILKQKNEVLNIKNKVEEQFKYIRENENYLDSIISNNKISFSVKNNLNFSYKRFSDNYQFNIEEIRIINNKIKSLINSQEEIINDLKVVFNNISDNYKSNKISDLSDYNITIFSSMKEMNNINRKINLKINDICNDYELMIMENINRFEEL